MNTQKITEQDHKKKLLQGLTIPGYLDDDLRGQIREATKSATQYIIDTLEHEYRKARNLDVSPNGLRQPLRTKAYLMYAEYCEQMAQDLRIAAQNPENKF